MSLNRRVEECIDVLQERKLDILGLSETKWKGKGTKEIRGGHHLYWSGGVNGRNGVGIILSDKMNEIVVDVNYVSDRLMIIKLKIDPVRILNLIQCYAPQAGSDDQEKQNFEQLLEDKIQDPNTLVMGDLNAQVGCDRQGFEEIMGAHGWGPRNAEGENLLDLCTRNSLVLTNTWFYKRKSHKVTRYGWNGQQESLIDYFLINKELHNTVIDVKVIPSVSLGSDHRLLVGTFRFKKLRAMKTGQDKKIKVWKLKDSEKAREFENKIREKVPNTEPTSVEEEWNAYKKSMIEAAEQVCGRTGGVRKWKETPWWNERTRKAVLEKNNKARRYSIFKHSVRLFPAPSCNCLCVIFIDIGDIRLSQLLEIHFILCNSSSHKISIFGFHCIHS
ncbi:craniofacial development protein 2-like [Diaphorina citri]|uniref:Craniofacial development protein 2-like n=1 Tax=Diaphorina citri TaxID=121845 RepID=A0A1S3DHD0_DIACI|nr:craniofacial development protein 2-like [Diaphorina citri]